MKPRKTDTQGSQERTIALLAGNRTAELRTVPLEPVADGGAAVVDVCRQIGISEATLYTWKKEYAELGVSELRKLKQLEDEKPWGRGRWLGL